MNPVGQEVIRGSWMGSTPRAEDVAPLPQIPMQEAASVELFDELLTTEDHDVVLLDRDTLGLLVDSELRAEYKQTTIYVKGSFAAKARMEKAARYAARAANDALGYERASKGTRAVHRSVDPKPATEEPEVFNEVGELSAIEAFIGPVSDATPAERANLRDKRPAGRDLLGMIPEPSVIAREVVEGNE